MSLGSAKDTPEQAEFRAHCQAWLKDNHPGQPPVAIPQGALELTSLDAVAWLRDWQMAAYEAGLVGCDYPKEYGGGGMSQCQAVANQELYRAQTPYFPNIIGLGMAAPTIVHHATEEVRRELLPSLFSAEHIWCQGFSEPGAGSDLANAQTFATKQGDNWVVNGHKVWTSHAHFADWMILLCRTDKGEKYNGLSYFVVPIKAGLDKGVTVRPLIKMTGGSGFNEVLFEDYVIEDRYRLDEVGAGWQVAMTTLTHERGAGALITPSAGGMVQEEAEDDSGLNVDNAADLIELAKQCARDEGVAADDPVLQDEIIQLMIRQEGISQNARRINVPELLDHPMRLQLQSKVLRTELAQDIGELAYDIEGAASSLYAHDADAVAGAEYQLSFMNSFGVTIAAGSSEIQRNILGERVLDLAKSK